MNPYILLGRLKGELLDVGELRLRYGEDVIKVLEPILIRNHNRQLDDRFLSDYRGHPLGTQPACLL